MCSAVKLAYTECRSSSRLAIFHQIGRLKRFWSGTKLPDDSQRNASFINILSVRLNNLKVKYLPFYTDRNQVYYTSLE